MRASHTPERLSGRRRRLLGGGGGVWAGVQLQKEQRAFAIGGGEETSVRGQAESTQRRRQRRATQVDWMKPPRRCCRGCGRVHGRRRRGVARGGRGGRGD
eukprot:992026-Prymnesium_polylepis.1